MPQIEPTVTTSPKTWNEASFLAGATGLISGIVLLVIYRKQKFANKPLLEHIFVPLSPVLAGILISYCFHKYALHSKKIDNENEHISPEPSPKVNTAEINQSREISQVARTHHEPVHQQSTQQTLPPTQPKQQPQPQTLPPHHMPAQTQAQQPLQEDARIEAPNLLETIKKYCLIVETGETLKNPIFFSQLLIIIKAKTLISAKIEWKVETTTNPQNLFKFLKKEQMTQRAEAYLYLKAADNSISTLKIPQEKGLYEHLQGANLVPPNEPSF